MYKVHKNPSSRPHLPSEVFKPETQPSARHLLPQREELVRSGARPSQTSTFCDCDEACSRQRGNEISFYPSLQAPQAGSVLLVCGCLLRQVFFPGGEGIHPAKSLGPCLPAMA